MSFNPNIKESNVRQFGTTQFQNIPSEQRIIAGIYGLPPLSNSRFTTAPAAYQVIQVQPIYTTVSQARLVTADWRSDSSRNQEAKYTGQTAQEGSNEKPKPVYFDYQMSYENLLAKYRKKEEKHRTTIKDLKSQLIIKDSLINSFNTEITAYRNTIDNYKLLTENGQLKKGTEDMERELTALRQKVRLLESGGDFTQAAKLQQRYAEIASLRKKIEEFESKASGSSIDKLTRDRSYYMERTATAEKQLKLKYAHIIEIEQELNVLTNQLNERARELEVANSRLSDKAEETRSNWERLIQLRYMKIKELESELTKKNREISYLNDRLEQIPKEINNQVDSLRAEWEKVVQSKDKKLLESDSDKIKAIKQWQEVRLQLEYVERELKAKDYRIQEQQNSNFELTKKIYDLKSASKAETDRVCELKDQRISELQSEANNYRHNLEETCKYLYSIKRYLKKTESVSEARLKSEAYKRDNRIESLQRELEITSKRDLETKQQLETVIIQQMKNIEEMKTQHANEVQSYNKKILEAQAQMIEAKSDISRSTVQSNYKIQELEKVLKIRELKVDQLEKDLALSHQMLNYQRQSSEGKQSDSMTKIGYLTRDQMNKQKKINEQEQEIKRLSAELEYIKTFSEQMTAGYKLKSEELTKTHRLHIYMKEKRTIELQTSLNDVMEECKLLKAQLRDVTSDIKTKENAVSRLQKDSDAKSLYIYNLSKNYGNDLSQRDTMIVEKESKIREYEQYMIQVKANLGKAEQEAKSFKNYNEMIRTLLRDKDAVIGSSSNKTNQLSEEVKNKNGLLQDATQKLYNLYKYHQGLILASSRTKQELESKISSLATSLLRAQNDMQAANKDSGELILKIRQYLNEEKIRISYLYKLMSQQKLLQEKEIQDSKAKIAYREQQLQMKYTDLKNSLQTILVLQDSIEQAKIYIEKSKTKTLEIEKYKEDLKLLKKQIYSKEQYKISLAESLLKYRRLSAYLAENLNSSQANNKSLSDILKSKLEQTYAELSQAKEQNRLLQKERLSLSEIISTEQQRFTKFYQYNDEQMVQFAIKYQQYKERVLLLYTSVYAMYMIIQKLNGVSASNGEAETKCLYLEKALKISSAKCQKLEAEISELNGLNGKLAEQLQNEQASREQALEDKKEIDKQTDIAIISIREQMLYLQMNSKVMLEQQQKDIIGYQEKLKLLEMDNAKLLYLVSTQTQTNSQSQQTSPQKKQQEYFVKLQDYTNMLEQKQVEIRVLNRYIDMYKKKLDALVETGCSPVKSGDEYKVTMSIDSLRLSLEDTKNIDYQYRYNAVLIYLGIHPEESTETIQCRLEALVNTQARYYSSVKELMQKIDWMEQNLNILNQYNSDYHVELENRDNNMVQLSKTIEMKEKAIGELRNYYSHLTKKLIKLEDLLEYSNKIIINQRLTQLNYRVEAKEREEAVVATKALLETQVLALKSKMKKMVGSMTTNNESIDASDIYQSLVLEEENRNSYIFDDREFERLKQSEDFEKLKRFFANLIQDEK